MPDETHTSIRRTYYAPCQLSHNAQSVASQPPSPPPTRRQFCGYCGTHLTAWNEGRGPGAADSLDVTLGSLESESVDLLAQLDIMTDEDEEEDEEVEDGKEFVEVEKTGASATRRKLRRMEDEGANLVMGGTVDDETHIPMTTPKASTTSEGLVKGVTIDDEDHIPTNEQSRGGADGPTQSNKADARLAARRSSVNAMRHRGIPYFEEIVENSRLGQVRRRMGGYTSDDGGISHEWEIVEIGDGDEGLSAGDGDNTIMTDAADHTLGSAASNKRQKTRP